MHEQGKQCERIHSGDSHEYRRAITVGRIDIILNIIESIEIETVDTREILENQ